MWLTYQEVLKRDQRVRVKVLRKMRQLITKAKNERDTKGYRENLGYDSENKFKNFLSGLDLSYSQESEFIGLFYRECDKI